MTERDLRSIPWIDLTDEEQAEVIAEDRRRNPELAERLDRAAEREGEEES